MAATGPALKTVMLNPLKKSFGSFLHSSRASSQEVIEEEGEVDDAAEDSCRADLAYILLRITSVGKIKAQQIIPESPAEVIR